MTAQHTKLFSNCWKRTALLFFAFVILSKTQSQTTITTTGTPYNGGNSLGNPAQVTFVVENTNGFPINITALGQYCTTAENNAIWQLYYSASSLSGSSTDVTVAPWTLVATSLATPVAATGITPLNFPGLSFTIPAGTQYRFALRNTGPGSCRYSGTGTAITPNTFSGGGVNLKLGDVQIAGLQVGYSGSGTALTLAPRYFTGSITFAAAGPCINPPVPGTVSSTANPVCFGLPFTLSLVGGTGGTGQSYQWQSSPDGVLYTDITGATNSTYSTSQAATTWYRCAVTCGVTVNSSGLQVVTPSLVSGTFTINNNQPTGGSNFNSFNDAYNYIKCGIGGPVVFNVDPASGPYNEQLIMTAVPGASAVNTVTFNGNGRTLQFLSSNTNERGIIKLNGAKYIRFDNLNITALGTTTTEYGFGVQLLNNADSNIVRNCTININTTSTSTNYAGIAMSSSATSATTSGNTLCDYNIFENNTINGGYYGITLVGSTTTAVQNNIVKGNTFNNQYNYGIYMLGNFNTLVDSNTIQRPARVTVTNLFSIYATSLNTKLNITRNTIRNPFGGAPASTSVFYGVYFTGVDALATLENVVSNNLIYNLTGNGDVYGLYNTSSDNVWYYHNTVVIDGDAPNTVAADISRGFYQTTLAGGIELKNNLFVISRGGLSGKHALYFNTNTTTYISNNNAYYISSTTGLINFGRFNAIDYPTLGAWQAATTQDAASQTGNPFFQDVANGNYKPTNAVLNNIGTPLPVTVDILGDPRSVTTPDPGAYEFNPGACVAPPVPGTSTVSESPVCANNPVTLSLTGNSTGIGQTYQWQEGPSAAGPWTNISGERTIIDTSITASTTKWYRCIIKCGVQTSTSVPVQLIVNPPLPGGTYTIDQGAAPSPTNFTSFNAAYNAMSCGIAGPIVINVVANSGPYVEQLIMDSIQGTSSVNTITFNGNGNTISFSSANTNERAVIKLRKTDYVTFDSLVIDASAGTYGYGVQLINNADNNTIRRCVINSSISATTTNYGGIIVNATETGVTTTGATLCDNNTFDRNTITGGYAGVTLSGSTAQPLSNNRVTNNIIKDYYIYGTYLNGNTGAIVEANDYSRPVRTAVTTFYGVYATTYGRSLLISKNRIHNPFDGNMASTSAFYGVYFSAVDGVAGEENRVVNNLIYNVNNEGDEYGLYNSSSEYALYYHNTLSFDNTLSNHTSTWWTRAIYQTGAASGIQYKNNIVTIRRTGNGDRHGMYFATVGNNTVSNRNDVFVDGPPTLSFYGFYNAADQPTLANWQAATGLDANSVSINPEFANPPLANFTPTLGAVDNLGEPVGVTTDILNAVRSGTTPDIGCYEFAIPPCVSPPTAGAAVVTPNSGICIGTTVLLTLTGNSTGGFQTYQWQNGPSAAGPWTTISPVLNNPSFQTTAAATNWYRCVVTCSGNSQNSTPASITLNPALLAGTYTINPALPPSTTNYQSFAAAVQALECGITGTVIFNAAAGIYNEQIRMHNVPGSSASARVIFQSANGNPASVTLTYGGSTLALNYVLKLDSASFITWRNMTFTSTHPTYGRVIEFANTASNDSITNNIINAPTGNATTDTIVGIFGTALRSSNLVIKGNTVNNGNSGILLRAVNATTLMKGIVIDSNTINSHFFYGIYTSITDRLRVSKNTVNMDAAMSATAYGIYFDQMDTLFQVTGNKVNINNTTGTKYGMYFTNGIGSLATKGLVASNTILAETGNTSTLYGLYNTGSDHGRYINNVISINTSGASSYGLYSSAGAFNDFWNNSVLSRATSATNNVAAYFAHTSGAAGNVDIQNNIFSHQGGGVAMQVTNNNFIYLDFNMLYTSGTNLVRGATIFYPDIAAWRAFSGWDINSIVYQPAFTSNNDLTPMVSSPDVWAMHGRGTQIAGNSFDFNNNPRPTTFTAGVPDLGAYEFLPTSVPPDMVATPATPVANSTQKFSFGSDTVAVINWGASVPATISGKRYSGVTPPGLTAPPDRFMYFYTDFTVPTGTYNYTMNQYYIDPWRGHIPSERQIRLAKTNAAGAWTAFSGNQSSLDDGNNIMTKTGLTDMYKFTGMINGLALPTVIAAPDSSNRGTRFWVPYAHHQFFETTNAQEMVIYMSAEQAANVTIKINGTTWVRNYSVPANTVLASDLITKIGVSDGRIKTEGLISRAISIESDVPIVAYAHVYGSTSSGASMLLPVGTYGYEYTAITSKQYYATNTFSHVNVVAEYDSTVVEITPSVLTRGGRQPGVPFTVVLNRGDVYQLLGELMTPTGSQGYDLTGTKVKALPNSAGKCLPFAMFSGSSRTSILCGGTVGSGNGDFILQQNFPVQAWGKRYLTAPTSNSAAANSFHVNIYRISVKDPTTVVRRNGVILTGIINNQYYEFESQAAEYIESDKPVMVAQFMPSTGTSTCANSGGNGDPEMFYISPLEQAVKRAAFYRNTEEAITVNYLTLIVPTNGVTSLRVDGSGTFDHTYPHPNLTGYTVVVKRWTAAQAQSTIVCDSAFTAITYGEGSAESYGYNAGTLVKNLNGLPAFTNVNYTGPGNNDYTCAGTPFKFKILIPVKPTVLEWGFSQVNGLNPNANILQNNPVASDSADINGRRYYLYSLPANYVLTNPGTFVVPIYITHPEIEGCNSRLEVSLVVTVLPEPVANFTNTSPICVGDPVTFTGTATPNNGSPVTSWSWNFGDATNSTLQNPVKTYTTAGNYNVTVSIISQDGCIGDSTKSIAVGARPVVTLVSDSIGVCRGTNATFTVQNPGANTTYNWYSAATGGTLLGTGNSYTINNVQNQVFVWVEGIQNGCASATRRRATAVPLDPLAAPVVVVDSAGVNSIRFRWSAVPGAAGYEVSVNGGAFVQPSSGATGLTHTVTGLLPLQTASLQVRALGVISCQNSLSQSVSGRTITDQIYIPNAFTPNGDGTNDDLRVYGYVIRELRFSVFNQWGQKIFETRNQNTGWDGKHNGKPQPSGVYMYICEMTLNDGSKQVKKGSINLVR